MTTLAATIKLACSALYQNALDQRTVEDKLQLNLPVTFADGVGASQAQKLFCDTRTLTASSTENIDLAGSLTDAFGATLTFAEIKAIIVSADSGNTNNVVVGGAASNAFPLFGDATDTISVKPGGFFAIVDPSAGGYTVTAGTGDILKIANSSSGTSVIYTIVIIGNP